MRTLSTLIIACALAGPMFAEAPHESNMNAPARTTVSARSHHRSHAVRRVARHPRAHARPAAKAATKVSGFNRQADPDFPWVLPA